MKHPDWQVLLAQLGSTFGVSAEDALGIVLVTAARLVPLVLLVPWFAPFRLPAVTYYAVTAALVLVFVPMVAGYGAPSDWPLVVSAGREFLVGLTFAVAAAAPLVAFRWGGSLIDEWRGLTGSAALTGPTAHSHLLGLLAVALFWMLGGHRLAFAAYADGMSQVSPSVAIHDPAAIVRGAARLVADALEFSFAIAGPAVLALLIYDLGWGFVGRATGAFPVTFVFSPLRSLVATAGVILGLPFVLVEGEYAFGAALRAAVDLIRPFASP